MTLQLDGNISLEDLAEEYGGDAPHLLTDYSEYVDKIPGDQVSMSEFYGTSAHTIILPDKSFDVYATKKAIMPAAYILEGSFDQYSNGTEPIQMVSVQNAVNGTVNLLGLIVIFTSTAGEEESAQFEYTVVNSSGVMKRHVVTMNVLALPKIVCGPDYFDLQQGDRLLLSASDLVKNDDDGLNGTLRIIDVGRPVGGSVALNGDTITFESTASTGQPASFEYTVKSSLSETQTGSVFINITPRPERELYIYSDTDSALQALAAASPASVEDVYKTWACFDGNGFYPNKQSSGGNAPAWQLLRDPDRLYMPNKVPVPNGFVSPEKVDNYTFEATVSSSDSSNGALGLVAAFSREDNKNYILTIVVTPGGLPTHAGGCCGVYLNYPGIGGGKFRLLDHYDSDVEGGWNGKKIRVKVQRQQDRITFYVSDWDDIDTYSAKSKMVIDLNADSDLFQFKGKQSYGYVTFSQPRSVYFDTHFSGGLETSMICDVESNKVWRYNDDQWSMISETIQEAVGVNCKVRNPDTGERFLISESNIFYLGKRVDLSDFKANHIRVEKQNVVLKDVVNSAGADDGVRVVALYEADKEEHNYLRGKKRLMTLSSSEDSQAQSGFNRVGGYNWFTNNKIDLNAADFVGGTVVFANGIAGRITQIGNTDGTSAYIAYDVCDYELYSRTV